MLRPKFGCLVLVGSLTACRAGDVDSHAGHDNGEADAALDEAACAGRGKPLSDMVLTPQDSSTEAYLTLVSVNPLRPIVGNNSWLFELSIDGQIASGLESLISVTPFMPDHGHGTPTIVRVEETDPGQYKLEPVHTRMAGYWEITVAVETPSEVLRFVAKVCVD